MAFDCFYNVHEPWRAVSRFVNCNKAADEDFAVKATITTEVKWARLLQPHFSQWMQDSCVKLKSLKKA